MEKWQGQQKGKEKKQKNLVIINCISLSTHKSCSEFEINHYCSELRIKQKMSEMLWPYAVPIITLHAVPSSVRESKNEVKREKEKKPCTVGRGFFGSDRSSRLQDDKAPIEHLKSTQRADFVIPSEPKILRHDIKYVIEGICRTTGDDNFQS